MFLPPGASDPPAFRVLTSWPGFCGLPGKLRYLARRAPGLQGPEGGAGECRLGLGGEDGPSGAMIGGWHWS